MANLRHNHAIHHSVVFLTVKTALVPRVPRARREEIEHLGSRFFKVVLTYGFMQEPDVPAALEHLIAEVAFNPLDTTYFLGQRAGRVEKGVGLNGFA